MKLKKMILLLIIVFINSFFLIQILSYKINPILYRYVDLESERITSNIVDGIVNDILTSEDTEDLFIIKKNKNDEIQTIDYNTKEVNNILRKISTEIQKKLVLLEDGKIEEFIISDSFKGKRLRYIDTGIVCEIPMGSLSGNGFISNLGPIIPIKMSFLGQVSCNLKTKVTTYGINNLYLEINVHVEVKEKITMPVMSKDGVIKIDAPLSIKIIQGEVPEYYGGSITSDSKIFTLPNN